MPQYHHNVLHYRQPTVDGGLEPVDGFGLAYIGRFVKWASRLLAFARYIGDGNFANFVIL